MEIKINISDSEVGNISDGYHTFNELYEHRTLLFCSLLYSLKSACGENFYCFKTKKSKEGIEIPGYFIAGCKLPPFGQITYHLHISYWDFLDIQEIERNINFDGHSASDVLNRLTLFCKAHNE